MKRLCLCLVRCVLLVASCGASSQLNALDQWFEEFKSNASDLELYAFLYRMPKGGDLHSHISGSGFSEWWYELALDQEKNGYRYYTKVKISNCKDYGTNEYGFAPYLMLFVNILESTYDELSECEKTEYLTLAELSERQKGAWLNSIRLDKPHEGRHEFFQAHWQRLNELYANPYIIAEILYLNMLEFSKEGLIYFEPQVGVDGFKT